MRPEKSEYATCFTGPPKRRYNPRANKQLPTLMTFRTNPAGTDPLMDDWLQRTYSRHIPEFGESTMYQPFGDRSNTMSRASSRIRHMQELGQSYTERYQQLIDEINDRRDHGMKFDSYRVRGGKGMWRHIKQLYGTGPALMTWVDGTASQEARGEVGRIVTPDIKKMRPSGKGPNRVISESYGAGVSNIAWIDDGKRYREGYAIPLPSMLQEKSGVYSGISTRLQIATPRKFDRS